MTPKQASLALFWLAVFCFAILTSGDRLTAAEYKPDQFLKLDLSAALLSPTPLGPGSKFVADDPHPVGPKLDRDAQARLAADAKVVATKPVVVKPRVAIIHSAKPGKPRILLARHHGNPLDAQASDTRIQVWPCNSGGICDWQK